MDLSSTITENTKQNINIPTKNKVTMMAILMCAMTAIFYCYEYYLRVAPSVMSVELKNTFNLNDFALGNLAACFYYAYTPMQIPVGIMMDRFGPRRVLTLACLFCVIGTYFFATTELIEVAQMGRFLVGFGSAFAYVGVLKISDIWLPSRFFALMAGISTALGMVGAMTGELLMAYMVNTVGWQKTMFHSMIAGVVVMILLWLILRDKVFNHAKNNKEQVVSPNLSQILQDLMRMCLDKRMWITGLIGCLTFLPLSAFAEIWAVPFLQSLGISKTVAASGSSMVFLGFAIGGPLFGMISDKISSRRIPLIWGSFLAAFFMGLVILFPSPSIPWMFSLLFLSSFFASSEILVFAIGNDMNRKECSGTAAAFINTVVSLGGMLLPWIIGNFLDKQMVEGVTAESIKAYSNALLVLPLSLILAGFLSIKLRESYSTQIILEPAT